jgi:Domain of unknown function (DUF397)
VDGLTGANWRKATYSGSGGGGCVEVASTAPVVLVRDTTDRGGAVLRVPASAWQAFADTLK